MTTYFDKFDRPGLDEAVDEIDAAVFSGDAFLDHKKAVLLQQYMQRCARRLLENFEPDEEDEE